MSTTPATVQVSAVTDIGAVAQALASIFKFADTLALMLNTPDMIAARQRADVQALLNQSDADLKAAQGGDKAAQVKIDGEVTG